MVVTTGKVLRHIGTEASDTQDLGTSAFPHFGRRRRPVQLIQSLNDSTRAAPPPDAHQICSFSTSVQGAVKIRRLPIWERYENVVSHVLRLTRVSRIRVITWVNQTSCKMCKEKNLLAQPIRESYLQTNYCRRTYILSFLCNYAEF